MANKTSQKKIDQFLADYESSRKSGGAEKISAGKGKSQYQTSQDKISGYLKEHEEVVKNSPSRQQMIALERKTAEEAARKKAQLQTNVQQALRDQAIDSVESQALAAIKQRLNQGLGEFRQTDLQQGPFSGYQDPVELALQAQDLKGVGPQKTWRAEALKLGQQAVEQRRQEYAQQGSVKDYAERFKQTQTVVPDEKERTENAYKYAQEVPYMADFEEISSKEGANTKRRRTEEEAKKYEEEKFWAEVNGSTAAVANPEQDLIDKYVSDQQLKVYNYLVNSGQQEYANEYWRGVKDHAQTLRNAADIKFTRDALAKLPEGFVRDTVGSALSVGANMANAVTGTYYIAEQEIREALTGERQELDPQDAAFQAGRARDALRQDVSEKLPGWGKFLYETGMSIADTTAMGVALGPTGGALLMGSGAAVDTVRDVKERGGSDQQALTMGLIAGGAELLTEKLGFDRLGNLVGGSKGNVFRQVLGAIVSEAGEEGATEIANILADVLVMGDKSEYDALVRQYMAQGMSEDGARRQVFKDLAVQVGLATLGGGLSGGAMGSGAAVVGTVARAAEQTAQRNAWREAVNYDAATNIFTEGARGGSTYENMRLLAEQAYDRQQETAPQSSAATAPIGKGEPDALPASRTVDPEIERMAQEYGEDASVFKSHYNGSDPEQYKRGFDAMFNAGKSGLSLEMLGGVSDQLTAGMDEATKQSIYTAGRNRAANTITPGVQRLTTKKLGNNQKTQLMILDAIGKEYGLEIDVVDSIKDSNAVYRKGGRRIVVALDAAEGAYVQAAAHEAVHYIRSMSPDGYDVLENVVLEHLTGEDTMFDLDTAISERMKQYEKANRQLSREDAIEEIVAEAVPTFFGDKEAVRAFVRENRTLAEKIRDFFVEFANKVREIAERYMVSQDRAEIAELLGNTEALKEIAQTFDRALREAQEKQGAAKSDGEVMTSRNESERNRALKPGEMKNEFEKVLTRGEWRRYYNELQRPHYDASLYDDGQWAIMWMNGKLIQMQMQENGEFSVRNIYRLSEEWYNENIRDLMEGIENGEYGVGKIEAWLQATQIDDAAALLRSDDRYGDGRVRDERKARGAGRGAAGVSGGRDAHGAGVREDAVGQDPGDGTVTDAGLGTSDDGEVAYPADQDVLYSLRTLPETDYVKERDKAAKALSKRLGVEIGEAQRYIDNLTGVAAMIAADKARLDFEHEGEYSAVKPNSDYKWTIDFSTLCKKRLLYTGTFDAIQNKLADAVLTEDDYIRLRDMMAKKGYEVACAFCYVESRRKNNGEIIAKFLDVYRKAQQGDGVMELGPSNRRRTFNTERGFDPQIASFNTSEGFTDILHNHRGVYDAYMYFMNARGVSKPKLIESRTDYTNEILSKFKSASSVRAMNRRGGLRLQSFSDFEVVNLLDMMQVVTDMSRVGLMSQAYTKVPEFARVFGGTGVKINLSLVTKGVDKNGKLIFDDVEGMPHEEAFRIREMYGENVGTILVGRDDATIRAAMADPRIDFIIPYHASGWSTANQAALGIAGYTNYTNGQNETDAVTGRGVKNYYPDEYWVFSKTGDENAQIYLEKCAAAGRTPKFPQFAGEPGYWKMLIDFKMYDNDGNGAPQRPVRPDVNMDEARRVLDEYKGGHAKLPVAKDVVEEFLAEYRGEDDGEVMLSLKKGEATEQTDEPLLLGEVMPADVNVDSESIRRQAVTAMQVGLRVKLDQQIKGISSKILRETGSSFERDGLIGELKALVNEYAKHGFSEDSVQAVNELAQEIIEKGAALTEQDPGMAAEELALRIQGDVMGLIGAKNAAQQLYGSVQRMRERFRKEYEAQLKEQKKARVAEFQRIAGELKAAKEKGDAEAQKKIMNEYRTALRNVDRETSEAVAKAASAVAQAQAKARAEKIEENRERARLRDRIMKRANDLQRMLIRPEKGKRVPTKLQGLVIDVLGALDVNGQRAAEAFKETKQAAEFREKLTGIKNFYAQVWDSQSKGESPEGLDGLMMTLSERNMAEMTEALEVLGSGEAFYLRDMDSKQLKSLDALLKNVKHTVDSIGKLWRIQRYESIIQLGDASIAEMDSRGPQKITNSTVGGARDFFVLDNMEPVSYGERLGEAGAEVIQSLMDGEKIKFGKIREASEATEKMLKEIGLRSYDIGKWRKHVQVVTLGGKNVRMTDAMLMSLYLTAKRPQGRQHLLANGMRIPTTDRTGGQVKKILLSEADLTYAAGLLSDKQRQLADRMGEYLSTAVAKWGNDVTQRLYLYDAFTEKNYWPITSDPNVLETQEPEGERAFNAIINAGFTKPVNQKATNAVIVMDAFDVFGNHIGEMASYAGYAEAMTDTMAWLNYKVRNSETRLVEGSVKESMESLLGKGGIKYLTNLVQDINGARRGGDNMQLNKLLGNYKKAAVMGKIRVAIQQPTSIVRAAAEINPWYLLKGLRPTKGLPKGKSIGEWLRSNGTVEEMQKWSNLAWWKAHGNYDIGIGKGTDAILWGDTSIKDAVMEKIATQGGLVDPGKMDDLTWAHMWLAVKSEIKRKREDLEVGSDEYFRAVAERFEYVMDRTQVVDTVMHRSALMRGKDGLVKSLTSFMSEPTKSYNMLMRAVMEVGRHPKDGAAHKKLVRTTLAYVASAAATAAMTALYDAFRYRDDEDDVWTYLQGRYWGNVWQQMLKAMISNVNPLSNIPIIVDVYDMTVNDGNAPTVMAFEGITDLISAIQTVNNYMNGNNSRKSTVYGVIKPVLTAVSSLYGLPLTGILTNVETIGRVFDPKWMQTKSEYATQGKAYEKLYEAIRDGNKEKAADIRRRLKEGLYGAAPKNPKEIDTGIAKYLALDDERIMKYWQMREKGNQYREMVALRKEIQKDGFTEEHVVQAGNRIESLLNNQYNEYLEDGMTRDAKELKEYAAKYDMVLEEAAAKDMEEELDPKMFQYDHLFAAIRNGDLDDVEGVAGVMEMESEAEDPEEAIRNQVSGEFREEYIAAARGGSTAKVRDLDKKLDYFGIDAEDRAAWIKKDRYEDLGEALEAGKTGKADEYVEQLRESGVSDDDIASSVSSRFKETYIDLVVKGKDDEAEELAEMLRDLGLVTPKGKNKYRQDVLDDWVEAWYKAQEEE